MKQARHSDTSLSGLARYLVAEQLLTRDMAETACLAAERAAVPMVRHLVQNRLLAGSTIAHAASQAFGLPLLDLDAFDSSGCPLSAVDDKLIRKHNVLPLRQKGQRLFLAVSDPSDNEALEALKFHTGAALELVVVEDDKLHALVTALLDNRIVDDETFGSLEQSGLDALDNDGNEETSDGVEDRNQDEAPIVRFVNKLLRDAIKEEASDIHIEPYEKLYRVRFRLDGLLKEIVRPPLTIAARISARIKIMARMDIAERRLPQDGRIKLRLSRTRAVNFRVNTLPTLWGEKIVLRLLNSSSARLGIDALGYEPLQKQLYLEALHRHQGLILVTGPTGSGKTVSLYTGLDILNTGERNISTAEDPVEIHLDGINQVAVNAKVGLDFATALRAFLRQDPDVVMVGEIRDPETAEIAIKAAQTGHLVLSTLHTNNAPETLSRLRNMGIPAYNIATSVTLIIAQRLARRLCSRCKTPLQLPSRTLLQAGFTEAQIGTLQLFDAVGCDQCHDGYKGRIGIYETLPITERLARVIIDDGNSLQIGDVARTEGFSTLRAAALEKVAQGLTSLAEVNRLS